MIRLTKELETALENFIGAALIRVAANHPEVFQCLIEATRTGARIGQVAGVKILVNENLANKAMMGKGYIPQSTVVKLIRGILHEDVDSVARAIEKLIQDAPDLLEQLCETASANTEVSSGLGKQLLPYGLVYKEATGKFRVLCLAFNALNARGLLTK